MRTLLVALILCSATFAQHSIEKAKDYLEFGLRDDAKREAIDVVYETKSPNTKSQARILLGMIALEEGKMDAAEQMLRAVTSEFSGSNEAKQAQEILNTLSGSGDRSVARRSVDLTAAQAMLGNADVWCKAPNIAMDVSWLPLESAAIYWLDRIATEFPKTSAAEVALFRKALILIGDEPKGDYGDGIGAIGARKKKHMTATPADFLKAMGKAEDVAKQLVAEFPSSPLLTQLRVTFVIAYWECDERDAAMPWMKLLAEDPKSKDGVWGQFARMRMEHWR